MVRVQWKRRALLVAASAAAIGLLLVAIRLSAVFRHRQTLQANLAIFERVITPLQTEPSWVPPRLTSIPIPANALGKVYPITAEHPAKSCLAVEFLVGKWVPVKRRGYVFLSAGNIKDYPDIASRWPQRYQLCDHWLYVSN